MPDDEKLEGQTEDDEEEEESKEKPKVVSLEDFNKLKSSLDGQISRERTARKRAEEEAKTLGNKFAILEKSLLPGIGDEDEDEEEEEEEGLFGKKKKKAKAPKGSQRRIAALEEELSQLKGERERNAAMTVINNRINTLLTKTGVSRSDPELDWAPEVDDPEEGYDRLMTSAIAIAEKRRRQQAEAKAKVLEKKEKPKIEKGGTRQSASSFLERWAAGEASKEEIEKTLSRGKRRTETGGSELDIDSLTS